MRPSVIGFAAVVLVGVLMTGCAMERVAESPDPATGTPSPSVTTAQPSDADAPQIPKDCASAVSAGTLETLAGFTLNDPAFNQPMTREPVAPDPQLQGQPALFSTWVLWCMWTASTEPNTPGLQIVFFRPDVAAADQFLDSLATENGYACDERLRGRWCQLSETVGGLAVGNTYFLRDGVAIWIGQTDWPTSELLKDVVSTVWKD